MERQILFMIAGDMEYSAERHDTYVCMDVVQCLKLLTWLKFEPSDFGYVAASELMARCRRRLWPEFRQGNESLLLQTEALLRLAERAGPDGHILFS